MTLFPFFFRVAFKSLSLRSRRKLEGQGNMSTTTAIPALDNTYGLLYLASVLTMALWGAGTVQVYYYFDKYHSDPLWMKGLVAAVWILDTAHQGLLLRGTYGYLITNYANVAELAVFVASLRELIILTALICFLVQGMFTMRIYRLSKKNLYLTGVIGLLVVAQLVSLLVYYYKCFHLGTWAGLETILAVTRTANILTTITDISIAAVLVFILQKNRTGFRKADTFLNRLMVYSVNTGLITAVDALLSLIFGLALPATFLYVLFFVMISRLYMNSLMASLNSRTNLKGGIVDSSKGENNSHSFSMNGMRNERPGLQAQRLQSNHGTRIVNIKVDTETVHDHDDGKDLGRTPSESDIEAAYPTKSVVY